MNEARAFYSVRWFEGPPFLHTKELSFDFRAGAELFIQSLRESGKAYDIRMFKVTYEPLESTL